GLGLGQSRPEWLRGFAPKIVAAAPGRARASHLEVVSRDQASSGRAARAPRRRPFTRADFWCTGQGPTGRCLREGPVRFELRRFAALRAAPYRLDCRSPGVVAVSDVV